MNSLKGRRLAALLLALLTLAPAASAARAPGARVLARAICFGQAQAVETYLAETGANLDTPIELGPRRALRPISLALTCLQSLRQRNLEAHVLALGNPPAAEDVLLERLLRLGADPVYQEPDLAQRSPMHLLLELPKEQQEDVAELLLSYYAGPDLLLRDAQGKTPIELADQLNPAMAKALRKYQPTGLSDLNIRDQPFAFAAGSRSLAALRRQEDLLESLARNQRDAVAAQLAAGSSPDIYLLDPPGRPLLHRLALEGRKDWLELLLAHDADPRIRDFNQREVLHLLAASDQAELIPWLAERGASPHSRDADGETPLFAAVRAYRPASIKALLALGADPNQPNAKGKSALAIAQDLAATDTGMASIVAMLQAKPESPRL